MPFQSEKQRRFMWAQHPDIARKWVDEEKESTVAKASPPTFADVKGRFLKLDVEDLPEEKTVPGVGGKTSPGFTPKKPIGGGAYQGSYKDSSDTVSGDVFSKKPKSEEDESPLPRRDIDKPKRKSKSPRKSQMRKLPPIKGMMIKETGRGGGGKTPYDVIKEGQSGLLRASEQQVKESKPQPKRPKAKFPVSKPSKQPEKTRVSVTVKEGLPTGGLDKTFRKSFGEGMRYQSSPTLTRSGGIGTPFSGSSGLAKSAIGDNIVINSEVIVEEPIRKGGPCPFVAPEESPPIEEVSKSVKEPVSFKSVLETIR